MLAMILTCCFTATPRSRPDPQKHLLSMYGLSPLLRSVARTDPSTGEKINKLRKSYEGQIKSFQLPGRNKPVKSERDTVNDLPGPLRSVTEDKYGEWVDATHPAIEVSNDLKAKFLRAMEMQPGTVRNNAHWEDAIGHEKPRAPLPQPQHNLAVAAPRIPNGAPRTQGLQTAEKRTTRGKKRSYGDDSFMGYGDGYSSGDNTGGDYEDEEGNFNRRKRKKVDESADVPSQHD